MANISYF